MSISLRSFDEVRDPNTVGEPSITNLPNPVDEQLADPTISDSPLSVERSKWKDIEDDVDPSQL